MSPTRRRFLAASVAVPAALCATPLVRAAELLPPPQGRRVVIVGGGWGGLSAARHLRALAPGLEVVLVEKSPRFVSLPLSNRWLAGLGGEPPFVRDYAAAAAALGYRHLQAEATAIDRERRQVVTPAGSLGYDWLVLAVGIDYDYAAWFGDDPAAAAEARRLYPAGCLAEELEPLRRKLDAFTGGDLLMTIPPAPHRCPPSFYERAALIGAALRARKLKARLLVVDANEPSPGFARLLESFKPEIVHVPYARASSVNLATRTVATEFDDYRFDEAILAPPQRAGRLAWQAGLIGRDEAGKPTGWADVEPLHLHARGDERVFPIGDLAGRVSPLFGQYPKSGHMAARMGRIAAIEIAARSQGRLPEPPLPESVCYFTAGVEPPELTRVETHYRIRGDGALEQNVHQRHDPNPRGADRDWAKAEFAGLFGG